MIAWAVLLSANEPKTQKLDLRVLEEVSCFFNIIYHICECANVFHSFGLKYLSLDSLMIASNWLKVTRKSSCVNARGIPPAV